MIEFKNVTKKYGPIIALNSVSFQIKPGEIVGLVGANGAGKTTAIKLLTQCISPEQGKIYIDDASIGKGLDRIYRIYLTSLFIMNL